MTIPGFKRNSLVLSMPSLFMVPGRMFMPEPLLEMDRTENPLRDSLIVPRFLAEDGYVRVPDAPGLGVDVDAGWLEAFARP